MPARKYSDELLDEAASLREDGMTYAQIASKLGMSESSVYFHCLRLGADTPKAQKAYKRPTGPMSFSRGGHLLRRFSESEDRQLLDLEAQGMRICDIARAMDRKPNSLRGRLMTLARIDEREEQTA